MAYNTAMLILCRCRISSERQGALMGTAFSDYLSHDFPLFIVTV